MDIKIQNCPTVTFKRLGDEGVKITFIMRAEKISVFLDWNTVETVSETLQNILDVDKILKT